MKNKFKHLTDSMKRAEIEKTDGLFRHLHLIAMQ